MGFRPQASGLSIRPGSNYAMSMDCDGPHEEMFDLLALKTTRFETLNSFIFNLPELIFSLKSHPYA